MAAMNRVVILMGAERDDYQLPATSCDILADGRGGRQRRVDFKGASIIVHIQYEIQSKTTKQNHLQASQALDTPAQFGLNKQPADFPPV